jgi:hypothetical protein
VVSPTIIPASTPQSFCKFVQFGAVVHLPYRVTL